MKVLLALAEMRLDGLGPPTMQLNPMVTIFLGLLGGNTLLLRT